MTEPHDITVRKVKFEFPDAARVTAPPEVVDALITMGLELQGWRR